MAGRERSPLGAGPQHPDTRARDLSADLDLGAEPTRHGHLEASSGMGTAGVGADLLR